MAHPTHPKCGKTYPGGNQAGHCATCCETFIGNTAFEAHRVGAHGTPERRCQISPYQYINELGNLTYGHWKDERGYYHHGRKLTDAEKEDIFGTRTT